MSRSEKDGRKGGKHRVRRRDFWSRRCHGGCTTTSGRYAKKLTLGIERMEQRALLRRALLYAAYEEASHDPVFMAEMAEMAR